MKSRTVMVGGSRWSKIVSPYGNPAWRTGNNEFYATVWRSTTESGWEWDTQDYYGLESTRNAAMNAALKALEGGKNETDKRVDSEDMRD